MFASDIYCILDRTYSTAIAPCTPIKFSDVYDDGYEKAAGVLRALKRPIPLSCLRCPDERAGGVVGLKASNCWAVAASVVAPSRSTIWKCSNPDSLSLDVPEQCCGLCAPALTRAGSAAWLSLYTPGRRPTFQPPEFPRKPRKPRKPAAWLSSWQRTAQWVAESAETPSDADAADVPATPSTALSG